MMTILAFSLSTKTKFDISGDFVHDQIVLSQSCWVKVNLWVAKRTEKRTYRFIQSNRTISTSTIMSIPPKSSKAFLKKILFKSDWMSNYQFLTQKWWETAGKIIWSTQKNEKIFRIIGRTGSSLSFDGDARILQPDFRIRHARCLPWSLQHTLLLWDAHCWSILWSAFAGCIALDKSWTRPVALCCFLTRTSCRLAGRHRSEKLAWHCTLKQLESSKGSKIGSSFFCCWRVFVLEKER